MQSEAPASPERVVVTSRYQGSHRARLESLFHPAGVQFVAARDTNGLNDALAEADPERSEPAGQARNTLDQFAPGVLARAVDGGDSIGDLLTVTLQGLGYAHIQSNRRGSFRRSRAVQVAARRSSSVRRVMIVALASIAFTCSTDSPAYRGA